MKQPSKSIMYEIVDLFDLAPKQAKALFVLYKHGILTVAEIAKHCSFKRTTTYSLIDELAERHLIVKTTRNNTTYYSATEMDILKERASKKHSAKEELFQKIESFQKYTRSTPILQRFEGIKGLEQAYTLLLNNAHEGETIKTFLVTDTIDNYLSPDFVDYFVKKRIAKKICNHVIMMPNEYSEEVARRSQERLSLVKVIKDRKNIPVTVDFKVVGKQVLFVSYADNYLCVYITSKDIAEFHSYIFDTMWEMIE